MFLYCFSSETFIAIYTNVLYIELREGLLFLLRRNVVGSWGCVVQARDLRSHDLHLPVVIHKMQEVTVGCVALWHEDHGIVGRVVQG